MSLHGWLLILWLGTDPWGLAPLGMEHILIGTFSSEGECKEIRDWNVKQTRPVHGPLALAASDCVPALLRVDGTIRFQKTWVRPGYP